MLDDDDTHFLDGKGNWTVPTGSGKFAVTPKTDNYAVQIADLGRAKVLTMNNVAEKTFTLPSVTGANDGSTMIFMKIGTGKLIIAAADADIIGASSGGGTVFNSTTEFHASITLLLIGGAGNAQWIVTGYHGSWVFT